MAMHFCASSWLCVPALAPRVLVIEDDDLVRQSLLRVLTLAGFQTLAARTVAGGCEQLALQPDVVLTGLTLPDGSGLDVVRRIRERHETVVVAVLTRDPHEDLDAAIHADPVDGATPAPAASQAAVAAAAAAATVAPTRFRRRPDAVFRNPVNAGDLIEWLRDPRPLRR
jgi:CheY-like chemotaxis protein